MRNITEEEKKTASLVCGVPGLKYKVGERRFNALWQEMEFVKSGVDGSADKWRVKVDNLEIEPDPLKVPPGPEFNADEEEPQEVPSFNWNMKKDDIVAELEKSFITMRLNAGRSKKASRGEYAGHNIPYGFRAVNKQLEPDPERLEIVREIFQRRAAGETLQSIADDLEARNVPTARGGRWCRRSINEIYKNRFYRGVYRFQGVEVENPHYNVISELTA